MFCLFVVPNSGPQGGWSQSDEVTPSYRDMIDNTVTGHEFLRRTLGSDCPNNRCVRFGWQIDMFAGYSAATPSLWSMMGYDAMVIRFEGPDDMRNQWGDEKAFEFLWEGGETLSSARSRILTHVMRWNYGDMLSSSCYGNCPPSRHPEPVRQLRNYLGPSPAHSPAVHRRAAAVRRGLLVAQAWYRTLIGAWVGCHVAMSNFGASGQL